MAWPSLLCARQPPTLIPNSQFPILIDLLRPLPALPADAVDVEASLAAAQVDGDAGVVQLEGGKGAVRAMRNGGAKLEGIEALMYGAGHGGFEAIAIVGLTMINNIAWSVMINNGSISTLLSSLSGDQLTQAQQSVTLLATTPSFQFLLGGVERLLAIALHIALSVIVWFAVKWEGKLYLYPVAILIHFAVDAAAALLSGLGVNLIVIELVVAVLTAAAALFARRLWQETM